MELLTFENKKIFLAFKFNKFLYIKFYVDIDNFKIKFKQTKK